MLRHRAPGLRPTAVLLVGALGGAGAPGMAALAAPAKATVSAEADGPADPLAEAQRLYQGGRAKFETADYQAAIESWTAAYEKVPDTPEGNQIKVLLIYNIATAREKAFDVSRDPTELRQAKILLGNFERSIDTLYGEGAEAEAERARVQQKIAELDERLAALESPPRDEPPRDVAPPEPEPTPEAAVDEGSPDPAARGLVIGGAVALSVGVAGLGMMAAGLGIGSGANDISTLDPNDVARRRKQFDRGRTGNTLAIAGGVAGGALLATGAVLLGLGLQRKRSRHVALAPSLGPRGASVVLRVQF